MGKKSGKNNKFHTMRIVYITNNVDPKNGWGRYASDLISGMRKMGNEVQVLECTGMSLPGSVFKARSLIRNSDIVHALDGYPHAIIAALANLGLHKKMVITVIGTYSVAPLYSRLLGFLLKFVYRRADKIISISNYTKNEIFKKINLGKVEVVNPGIDFDKFYAPRLTTDSKFILSVGALKNRKGYQVSIPAFAETKKTIPDLTYKIVGDQSNAGYLEHLKELTKKFKIEDSVEFIKNISDKELRKLYQEASLFVLTSVNEGHHFEGFGLVFLEAAAAGLPVIGTLGNGIEDAVKDGYNGFLIPQKDVKKTIEAQIAVLNKHDLWKSMSQASYQWAKEHDTDSASKKYQLVYSEIIK